MEIGIMCSACRQNLPALLSYSGVSQMETFLLLYLNIPASLWGGMCLMGEYSPHVPIRSGAFCFPQAFISLLLFPFSFPRPAACPLGKPTCPLVWQAALCVGGAPRAARVLSSETLLFQSHIDLSAAANVYGVCCRCFAWGSCSQILKRQQEH